LFKKRVNRVKCGLKTDFSNMACASAGLLRDRQPMRVRRGHLLLFGQEGFIHEPALYQVLAWLFPARTAIQQFASVARTKKENDTYLEIDQISLILVCK
jgi:hypothetical protein